MTEPTRADAMPEATRTMARLRETTRELHSIAERSTFARAILDATLPHAEYVRLLGIMRLIHATLEPALERSADARVRALAASVPSKLPLLDRDLNVLAAPPPPSWPSLDRALGALVRHLHEAAAAGVALLGALYVIEGATNGGQFLAMRLAQSREIPAGALGYYEGYGAQTIARWCEFGARVALAVREPAKQAALVGVARGLFADLALCFDELGEALGRRPASAATCAS